MYVGSKDNNFVLKFQFMKKKCVQHTKNADPPAVCRLLTTINIFFFCRGHILLLPLLTKWPFWDLCTVTVAPCGNSETSINPVIALFDRAICDPMGDEAG